MTNLSIKLRKRYIKVCPKCKYSNIAQDPSTLQKTQALPPFYICRICGHSGYVFPEILASKLKKFEEEIDTKNISRLKKEKTDLIDISYGKFEINYMWKITGPITLSLGILIFMQSNTYETNATLLKIYGLIMSIIGTWMIYITYYKHKI